jgi:regulator of replication initiation timing
VESATIDQLKETVLQLRTVKREMHDRLKAAELESIHLRRKLEAAVQKLRNLRAKASKDKQQRKGASKPGKPKPAKPM